MKFKILPKVDGFRDAQGVLHLPGDVVDLPESYLGETWLKRHEPEKPKLPSNKALETPEAIPQAAQAPPIQTEIETAKETEKARPGKKAKKPEWLE